MRSAVTHLGSRVTGRPDKEESACLNRLLVRLLCFWHEQDYDAEVMTALRVEGAARGSARGKARRSWANPPSTGYQRPAERRFYIWQDRRMDYRGYSAYREGKWGRHPWRWLCTYCDPPASGFQARSGAFQRIISTSMPKHFERRQAHHRWAARKPPGR